MLKLMTLNNSYQLLQEKILKIQFFKVGFSKTGPSPLNFQKSIKYNGKVVVKEKLAFAYY